MQADELTTSDTSKSNLILYAVDDPPQWATQGDGMLGEPAT